MDAPLVTGGTVEEPSIAPANQRLRDRRAALFLTGDESSFITGVALAVDGGRTFH
jgi:NAD(P)-dependent dehydrogenase (short-subunit alcohol dehydrogenase family)